MEKIFNDKNECLSLLNKFKTLNRKNLIYVYRIRNKIVHNAHTKITPNTNYYLNFISGVCSTMICEIIEKRTHLETVDSILNNLIYDFELSKLNIEKNGAKFLLRVS